MSKQAVLVISFGTSYPETYKRNIYKIEEEISAAFPNWEIRQAFTSGMIRKKLQVRDDIHVDSVEEALHRLSNEGFEVVLCQPTHIIAGEEYNNIIIAAKQYSSCFTLRIGTPLLTCADDYKRLAKIFSETYPPREATVYCLMGHGSRNHPADASYAALDYHFKALGRADICVGTVEGFPDFATMLHNTYWLDAKRYVLIPLMVVAGDHVINDMASDKENSWKMLLQQKGYIVNCIMKGLGEYHEIRKLYVQHLKNLYVELMDDVIVK